MIPIGPPATAGTTVKTGAAGTAATIAYAKLAPDWQLVLTDGRKVNVPQAFVKAPADAVNSGYPVPFVISEDGRHFFYYRRSDGLLVERMLGGGERVVSRRITVDNVGEEWPMVSADGSYVITRTSAPGLGVFVDLRTGKTAGPPEKDDTWAVAGFSPDQQRLLLAKERELVVFDRGLRARKRLKSSLEPWALANDHVTAAVPVCKKDRCRGLRLLDLRTGRATAPVTVRLPSGRYIDDLNFDRAGRVIVRTATRTKITFYRASAKTGKVKKLRTVTRVKGRVLPGDDRL
ncbi:hypothetical protein Sru01_26860 [Sphaerisporangium rufum]|uniref:Uncharacterized protein n=1 Tax=Sphaerisporangium rufum TaxID=1381558 RepID=A0A919R133_9ACTN|nr:hypothetical protein Sru01_26860 [Sphaerisporangium rufum]